MGRHFLYIASIGIHQAIDPSGHAFYILEGPAHRFLRIRMTNDVIDVIDHIIGTGHQLTRTFHHIVHGLAVIAVQIFPVSHKLGRILAGRNGNNLFSQKAVCRNCQFRAFGNFRSLVYFHGNVYPVLGRRHIRNLADVNADIADGIAFLQAIGITEHGMNDIARLAKYFRVGQVDDYIGKNQYANNGYQADFCFCTPFHGAYLPSCRIRPPWMNRCICSSGESRNVSLSAISRKTPSSRYASLSATKKADSMSWVTMTDVV